MDSALLSTILERLDADPKARAFDTYVLAAFDGASALARRVPEVDHGRGLPRRRRREDAGAASRARPDARGRPQRVGQEQLRGGAGAAADRRHAPLEGPVAGVWPRASALLARQSLEAALDRYWTARGLALDACSTRAQLICLAQYLDDRVLAGRVHHAWGGLSDACHHHAYDLAPTVAEVRDRAPGVEWPRIAGLRDAHRHAFAIDLLGGRGRLQRDQRLLESSVTPVQLSRF